MVIKYNPNPKGRRVGDCAVRAITKALDLDWDTAFALISAEAYAQKNMPSANVVWGNVLYRHGYSGDDRMISKLMEALSEARTEEERNSIRDLMDRLR